MKLFVKTLDKGGNTNIGHPLILAKKLKKKKKVFNELQIRKNSLGMKTLLMLRVLKSYSWTEFWWLNLS